MKSCPIVCLINEQNGSRTMLSSLGNMLAKRRTPEQSTAPFGRVQWWCVDICGSDICGPDICGPDICGLRQNRHLRPDICGADICGPDICVPTFAAQTLAA
uniref:Uncharacterized protein n=1 Tax=Globodera rostochiensis TaxID=31243 RepID=A0A914HJS2_GLORO